MLLKKNSRRFRRLTWLILAAATGFFYRCDDSVDQTAQTAFTARDTIAPEISMLCKLQDTAIMPAEYNDPGVIVKDNADNTPYLQIEGTVNHTLSGNYVLRYDASDAAGNKSTASRTVAVIENAAAPLMGEYDATCTCTATAKNDPASKIFQSTYTAKVTLAKKNRNFEIWLLRVGPEDLLGQCALVGDSIDLGFFSNRFNWQCSGGRGRFSGDTLVFTTEAYEWSPVVVHRCINKLVKKEIKTGLNF